MIAAQQWEQNPAYRRTPASALVLMKKRARENTHFLNVDLEVSSKSDLQPLAKALEEKLFVLYVGRFGRYKRTYHAHFEVAGMVRDPDSAIRDLCSAIRRLPKPALRLWKSARSRDFNIGVQAGAEPVMYELALQGKSVKAASDVNARIVLTIYSNKIKDAKPAKFSGNKTKSS
jgi:hypothetical protein